MQRIVFSQGYECKKWQGSKVYATHPQPSMRACPDGGNNWQLPSCSHRYEASALPTSIDLAPLALYSGRGVGGEGFCTVF